MRKILTLIGAATLLAMPAQAQLGPIEDIIEDIIGDPQRHPSGSQFGIVETIPIEVSIESLRSLDGHSLVLNVFKPVQPGMTAPELIGQSRISLTGMPNNLGMAVFVPEPVTRDLDFAVVNGVVLDPNGNEIMVARQEEFYRGRGSVELDIITPGAGQTGTPSTPVELEKLKGKAYLPKNAPDLTRGASMTVELVEIDQSGLAGGGGPIEKIISQTFVSLDKEKSPFKYKMEYAPVPLVAGKQVILRAYIADWAGRRIYEDYRGQPFRGEDDDYRIELEPVQNP